MRTVEISRFKQTSSCRRERGGRVSESEVIRVEQINRSERAHNGNAEWVTRYTWPRGIPYRYLQRSPAKSLKADSDVTGESESLSAEAPEGDRSRQYRW
jgi:hypothetical protein